MGTARVEEPVTPAGRLFLRPEIGQVIHCLLGGNHPINVDRVKSEITNSMMVKHPRFHSLLVTDRHGREYWKKTTLDIDRHVIFLNDPVGVDPTLGEESAVNDYLADLSVSSPLSTDKPLWEIHLLMAHNCAVLRVHHALGDGISLMSMFLTSCRQAEDPEKLPTIKSTGASSTSIISMISGNDNNRRNYRRLFWGLVKMVWFTVVYVLEFVLRTLWVSDKRTALSGGAGVELWPRKLATAKFLFDDMRTVKNAVPHAVSLVPMLL